MVGRHFPSLNRIVCRQSREIKHATPNKMSYKTLSHKLNEKLFNDLPNTVNILRVTIARLNKKPLKDFAGALHDRLNLLEKSYKHRQWYLVVIDVVRV